MLDLIGLGILAGVVPVYLGIAIAMWLRKSLPRSWETRLIGLATGVLVYLFFDLMHESVELTGVRDFSSWILFLGSLFLSFVGLALLEQQQLKRGRSDGTTALPYVVAAGMGLHNLGEGLAIGASFSSGAWQLSWMLVIGFALHNGTEGFGIIGAAGKASLSLRDSLLLGVVGGVPTCLGTLLSGLALSPSFSLVWYALAAGSLLYVVFTLSTLAGGGSRKVPFVWGVWTGIVVMFTTAMLLTLVTGHRS
jgi:ZIP family zinc transporter